jgi:MOSC domain-containing protein YiiM
MAKVIAVCRSDTKGVPKNDIRRGFFKKDFGLIDDAHAECGSHRQTSLLDMSSIEKMRQLGLKIKPGDFAENITTEGIELISLPIGTKLRIGDEVVAEITQIGKECHTGCAIFRNVGKCIMPKEGVFARILKEGYIQTGDTIEKISENKAAC